MYCVRWLSQVKICETMNYVCNSNQRAGQIAFNCIRAASKWTHTRPDTRCKLSWEIRRAIRSSSYSAIWLRTLDGRQSVLFCYFYAVPTSDVTACNIGNKCSAPSTAMTISTHRKPLEIDWHCVPRTWLELSTVTWLKENTGNLTVEFYRDSWWVVYKLRRAYRLAVNLEFWANFPNKQAKNSLLVFGSNSF